MNNFNENNGSAYKLGIFYFSKSDHRVLVPKRSGLGWTLNFASPWAYMIIAVLIGVIIYTRSIGK